MLMTINNVKIVSKGRPIVSLCPANIFAFKDREI